MNSAPLELPSLPVIVSVIKLENGVVVTFEDGREVLYPADLLMSIVSQAKTLIKHRVVVPLESAD